MLRTHAHLTLRCPGSMRKSAVPMVLGTIQHLYVVRFPYSVNKFWRLYETEQVKILGETMFFHILADVDSSDVARTGRCFLNKASYPHCCSIGYFQITGLELVKISLRLDSPLSYDKLVKTETKQLITFITIVSFVFSGMCRKVRSSGRKSQAFNQRSGNHSNVYLCFRLQSELHFRYKLFNKRWLGPPGSSLW